MEGLTFPVGKLCRIRKVLGGELYHVSISKLESGPVEVVAELDNDTMATTEELLANTHKMSGLLCTRNLISFHTFAIIINKRNLRWLTKSSKM